LSDRPEETSLGALAGVSLQGPYHALRVARVVDETADARSIVLEVPEELRPLFSYQAGQFLTFRFEVEGRKLVRCYSLASCPHSEDEHKVTVKRIQDGRVSNWINDTLAEGHFVEVMRPAGLFTLQNRDHRVVLFGAGSGITPCISIVKTALATTRRPVLLVYANRDEASVIFRDELARLEQRHGDRLRVVHRYDAVHGFLDAGSVRELAAPVAESDYYVCGPSGFMDVVERTLRELGAGEGHLFIERFGSPEAAAPRPAAPGPAAGAADGTVTITLDGETREVPWTPGTTVLETARQGGLEPPFACEEGYCGCCMARLAEGRVEMKANDCLDPSQVEEGWILTCQGVPCGGKVRVEYPD